MALKKEVWKKKGDSLEFVGYLPMVDYVDASEYKDKIADIIAKINKKADTFGVGGTGLTFNNNSLEINTDVMATKEWVQSQGYSSESIINQQIEDLQHDVATNSEDIKTNKASIATLTNDVANRYTKGETVDNSYAVYMPRISVGADPSTFPAQNKVNFNEIGNGSWIGGLGYQWWHVMTMQGGDTDYFTQIAVMMAFGDTPQLAFRNKSGEDSWAVAISNRTIASQHVAVADTYTYGRGVYLDSTSVNDSTSWVKAVFGDEGDTKFHITEVRTMSTSPASLLDNYSSGIAWKGDDTFGALTVRYAFAQAYLTGGNGTSPNWGAYVVLSSKGSDISDQSVAYAEKSGYANVAGKAAECSSTTLLKAEGTNLGAKIQSQYTSGAVGNVTYNQATWYVVGNDGETYNLGKMVTTDNFKSELTEALKTTSVEYCTRADNTSTLDSGNYTSSSLSLTYDSSNTTGLTYQSWPKLTIKSNTGFGIVRGGVDGKGAFQIACGVDGHSLFYRYVKDNASPYGWVRLLTESNLSVVDNLTSTSAEAPLSANQGRILNNKFSNYQPSLGSYTGATMQWLSFKNGSSYSISGIWCTKVEMTIEGSVGNQANANFTVDSYYQSSFSNGTWYFVAMPSSGGYINTLSWGLETNSSNTGGVLYALRVYSGTKTTYKFNIIGIRLY